MSLLTGLKTQAMAMLPQLVQTAEPQIEAAVVTAMNKMSPEKKQLFSSNLDKLNKVVQQAAVSPNRPPPPTSSLPPSPAGGKKRKTRKVRKYKKRT